MRWRSAIIKKGKHRSTIAWRPFFGKGKVFHFAFNESARYGLPNPHELDVNKIIGFADGCLNHHKNSFRLGWRYNLAQDTIEILAYTYVDGVRDIQRLDTIGIFDAVKCEVTCQDTIYRVVINDHKVHYVRRSHNIKWGYKHLLYPYFGGKMTAPHSILMLIHWKRLPKNK